MVILNPQQGYAIMFNYTVYKHICPNGKIYVGITKNDPFKRWANGEGYKGMLFYKAIQKYGWGNIKHEILYENLTKEEACQKEIELIAQYKSNQRKFGYNCESGGLSNWEISDQTREKLRISHLGQLAWNKGLKMENDQKIKIRNSLPCKPIMCIEACQTFSSIQQAAKIMGIPSANISAVCRGIRKTANKYSFKYL